MEIIRHLLNDELDNPESKLSKAVVAPFPEFPGVKVYFRGFGNKCNFWKPSSTSPLPKYELFSSESRLGFLFVPIEEQCRGVFRICSKLSEERDQQIPIEFERALEWRGVSCVLAHAIAELRAKNDSLAMDSNDIIDMIKHNVRFPRALSCQHLHQNLDLHGARIHVV